MRIDGERWTQKIEYDSQDEIFRIELPEKWKGVLGRSVVVGTSADDVRQKFREKRAEYGYRIRHVTRKVIVYTLKLNAEIIDEKGETLISKRASGYSKNPQQAGIVVEYKVGYETSEDEKYPNHKYHDEDYKEIRRYGYGDEEIKVLTWTAEREAWFQNLVEQLGAFSYQAYMHLFNEEKLGQIIDQNALDFKASIEVQEK
jgi:hypothetical protein